MTKPKSTRQVFGEILAELGSKNLKIVVCDADLSKSTKSELFAKKFPERFFQLGIAEANMIGTGAGLGLSGFIPFICSFGCFVTGRYDQIRMSVAYAGANVRIVGTHAGLGIGDDGHSQMGLEDLSLMRGLPTMMVFQPCDEIETRQIMEFLVADREAIQRPAYLRLTRQALVSAHSSNYHWQFGKLDFLRRGHQVAILSTGAAVQECLCAVEALKEKGLDPTLVNVPTIKPMDVQGIWDIAKTHQYLFTVEDHYVTGGLGSAVSEVLAESGMLSQATLIRLGVQDAFGESGEAIELYAKFGFSGSDVVRTVLKSVS